MTDRGRRDAELVQVIQPAYPGALAPNSRIAQDHRLHACFRRAISRVFATMRCRDRGAPARFRRKNRDAVEDEWGHRWRILMRPAGRGIAVSPHYGVSAMVSDD